MNNDTSYLYTDHDTPSCSRLTPTVRQKLKLKKKKRFFFADARKNIVVSIAFEKSLHYEWCSSAVTVHVCARIYLRFSLLDPMAILFFKKINKYERYKRKNIVHTIEKKIN